MKQPSHEQAFQVLLLQAADEGRGPLLFGDSLTRAKHLVPPFLLGEKFPDVYLEHPLVGDPFLDVTVLLGAMSKVTLIDSPLAGDHGAMLEFCNETRKQHEKVSYGFEIDTSKPEPPVAAIHFQPRELTQYVEPFCDSVNEPERAKLYLDLNNRMPKGWPLSFFGMFRGRPGFPLRVCGYLATDEVAACARDSRHLARAFDAIGFRAYDDTVLNQASALMESAPGTVDFQFDVFPDGTIGDIFALDVQFEIEQPEAVRVSFDSGPGSRVMGLLQQWGAADDRWHKAIESAFARALPVEKDDGENGSFAFTLMPQWVKARWTDGVLQPSKLYHLANAGLL